MPRPLILCLHQAGLPISALLFNLPCFRVNIGRCYISRNFLGIHSDNRFIRLIRHALGNVGLDGFITGHRTNKLGLDGGIFERLLDD